MDANDLQNRFEYHPPVQDGRKEAHEMVRSVHFNLALWLNANLPEGREKSLVITKIEESMFWANAAIARQP